WNVTGPRWIGGRTDLADQTGEIEMKSTTWWAGVGVAMVFAMAAATPGRGQNADEQAIRQLISTYAHSIDMADTAIADQIWSNSPEVSFIHPRGEEHGLKEIEADVYRNLMGTTFSKRKFTPKDIMVHVYGDTAWSEFQWDFVATVRADGSEF